MSEEVDGLGQALEDLRREIRRRFASAAGVEAPPSASEAAEREGADAASGGEMDWFALFDELRRRSATLGMSERTGEVDEFGMDEFTVRRARPLLEFLRKRYWRVDVAGVEGLPESGPVLFVANRSGLLPYDGFMISHVVSEARPDGPRPRFLVADWLITLPFVHSWLARLGGVRACRENAERLLGSGRSVVAFPEGAKGAAKVFRERYRLQRFGRGGVIRLAIEAGVPIVPVAVVGAEEAHPVLFKVETLARNAGLSFLPITPTFPLLGPFGALPLPSKWSIRFGEALATDDLGVDAARDELLLSRMTEDLRARIQAMLDTDLRARPGVFG